MVKATIVSSSFLPSFALGQVRAGLFDGLFGNSQADMEKEEAYRQQQEILAARRDPKKQQKYYQEVNQRRQKASDNVKELFNLSQGGKQGGCVRHALH